MKGFRIPFISNVPVEKEEEISSKVKSEMMYEKERERKIGVSFNNANSRIRKVADYLWSNINQKISYEMIAGDLDIPESTAKYCVSELNFYKGFPITMIPVPKKAGYIQSVLDNENDYEDWDRKKMKTITTMSGVKDKAEKITSSKRKVRTKVKEKEKEMIVKDES